MPRQPRSAASARPTGPAPTIRIGVSIVPDAISDNHSPGLPALLPAGGSIASLALAIASAGALTVSLTIGSRLRRSSDSCRGRAASPRPETPRPSWSRQRPASTPPPFGRDVRGGEEGTAERGRRRYQAQHLPLLRRLRQFVHQRQVRIVLFAHAPTCTSAMIFFSRTQSPCSCSMPARLAPPRACTSPRSIARSTAGLVG